MEPTTDPDVFIEKRTNEYVRYRRISDECRWEVHGKCDKRGDCLIGSVIDGIEIEDHEHLEELKQKLGQDRIDSELDVPITPEFKICCGSDIFKYIEL